MDKGTYIHALDNGLFTLGAPHKEGLCLVEAMEGKRLQYIFYNIHSLRPNSNKSRIYSKGMNPLIWLFHFFSFFTIYQLLATPSFQYKHLKTFCIVPEEYPWESKTIWIIEIISRKKKKTWLSQRFEFLYSLDLLPKLIWSIK